jgi:hypothetical protein
MSSAPRKYHGTRTGAAARREGHPTARTDRLYLHRTLPFFMRQEDDQIGGYRIRLSQPGQQVPALGRRKRAAIPESGAAGGADLLRGDEVSFARQAPVRGAGGDDPAVGQFHRCTG